MRGVALTLSAMDDNSHMTGRRAERRKACISQTEISWQAANGEWQCEFALIEDVSDSGVGVRAHASVPVGSRLQFKLNDQMVFGEVQHCTIDRHAYYIGVRVSPESVEGLSQATNA